MLVRNLAHLPGSDARLVALGKRDQRLKHARLDDAVLVQREHERRAAACDVRVVATAEADVRVRAIDLDLREALGLPQRRQRVDARGDRLFRAVVVNEQRRFEAFDLLGDAFEQCAEQREIRAERDDADVNGGHGALD